MCSTQLEGHLVHPPLCASPIFIIGSPRSGTTALAWSLARHSRLWTSIESDFLFYLLNRQHVEHAFARARFAPGDRWLKRENVEREEFYAFLGLGLNALFTSRSQGKRWIDNTPLYTRVADDLASLFPGAVFIHILRDGRRVVNSMINFIKAEAVQAAGIKADFVGSWATDFSEACKTWREYVETAAAFCKKHPTRSLTVRNEQLLDDPHAGFGAILKFLQLTDEPGAADHFRSHRMNSSFQRDTSGSLTRQSFPNPWDKWTDEQRTIFVREAGPTMVKHGLADLGELSLNRESAVEHLALRICERANSVLPPGATVAVVSKGDDRLLNLFGRRAWHFPQDESGAYSGYHPADSGEAIAHLKCLQALGAEYLVVPRTSKWWLDHYVEFRQYLERGNPVVLRDESCTIFALNTAPPIANPGEDKRSAILRASQESAMPQGQ